jgi:hypothetical protein
MATHNLFHHLFVFGSIALFAVACGGEDMSGIEDPQTVEDESAIFGSDACKNTDIKITNSFEDGVSARQIRVLNVQYYSSSEGRWYTEDLANTDISYGSSHWWYDEDLQYAENDTITQFKIVFNYRESDGDWSDSVSQIDDITNVVCHAGQNFYLTVN